MNEEFSTFEEIESASRGLVGIIRFLLANYFFTFI